MAAKISVGQQVISRNLSFFWLIYVPIHPQFVWGRLSLDADFLPWLARIGALSGRFYCYHHSYSRSGWNFGKIQRLSDSDCLGIPRQDAKDRMGTIVSVFGIEIYQPFYGSDSSWRTTMSKGHYRRGAFQISIDSTWSSVTFRISFFFVPTSSAYAGYLCASFGIKLPPILWGALVSPNAEVH